MTHKSILSPLLSQDNPVDWLFVFKFNAKEMPGDTKDISKTGLFDAPDIQHPWYDKRETKFSRHYIYSSSANQSLQLGKGDDVVGSSLSDPLGATFGQVYLAEKAPYYVLWNDQFYGHPLNTAYAPWGHSKGMLAWDDNGEGFVLQVSTPSWPGAGNQKNPRLGDGNTLGFVHDDDILVSQHFFALKLKNDDVEKVLTAMANASVCTKPDCKEIVNNGGPKKIQDLVNNLGVKQKGNTCLNLDLSSGGKLISKPSYLHVPPWQLVSAELNGVDLRVASWWAEPKIYSTTRENPTPGCWSASLKTPGAVEIATSGTWSSVGTLGLEGGLGPEYNHAKFGVSTSNGKTLSIFGDMNQQGSLLEAKADISQNGRGGLFFVMDDPKLHQSITKLLQGNSAPVAWGA